MSITALNFVLIGVIGLLGIGFYGLLPVTIAEGYFHNL